MKIAVFIYSLGGGGAERVVSQLIPYLENNGFDVYLVLMNNTCVYPFETKNKPFFLENSKTTESNVLKFLKIPFLAYKYHIFLKKNKINKSFSFLTRPGFISVLTKWFNKKRTIIISERSNSSLQYGNHNLQSWINNFLIKELYPKADLIIANSNGNAQDLITNYNVPRYKITTIYNPISLEAIFAIEPKKDFFDTNYFNLVSVGRLDNGKNHQLLIKSLEFFKLQKVRLYIFGDGILKTELEKTIKDLKFENRVFLMGFESNPYKYLKAADLFVFSSNHEGFPNVILEAMACELPIVSTNCPSGPNEIFKVNTDYDFSDNVLTDYGILVPRNNIKKMVEAINILMQNKKYYQNCKTQVVKRVEDFEANKILDEFKLHLLNHK
jgi:N-acetylgalactosamine-N,N'-diacetylbacillosaminyl-diphospho-undecaprenol 4-alpha-N-acetylgalactosaminyltransferase